ncbi:MAG: ABC transporter ATP-binding protein [Acidobacteriota bacterium]|nr:MAG: ABC transporter ATP-binding protein [Acidobacteriota bacterium]
MNETLLSSTEGDSSRLRLSVRGLSKSYAAVERADSHQAEAKGRIEVLRGLSFDLREGESLAVVGVSGVGKSTLLYQLGALDTPDEGEILFHEPAPGGPAEGGPVLRSTAEGGRDVARMSPEERTAFRAKHVGFVFQHHHLLPEFTALENAAMPLLIQGEDFSAAAEAARARLEELSLEQRLHHHPAELSAGEAQRAAIARALVARPTLLLADEPTGNLDEETAHEVFSQLLTLASEHAASLVLVTHNAALARRCGRCMRLHRGTLHAEELPDAPA